MGTGARALKSKMWPKAGKDGEKRESEIFYIRAVKAKLQKGKSKKDILARKLGRKGVMG